MRTSHLVFPGILIVACSLVGWGCSDNPACNDLLGCGSGGLPSTTSSTSSADGSTTATTGGMGGASSASGATSATSASASGSTGTGSGITCGGKLGKMCLSTEYCDFPADKCSLADETGSCTLRPTSCPDVNMPTCACDGTVYPSACAAAQAGVDLSLNGTCTPPTGKFACGSGFCEAGVSYCERDISDVGGIPTTYQCKSLPPSCGLPATCACLANVPCGSMCAPSTDGAGLVVTCPGG
jgi:hypothetical protein